MILQLKKIPSKIYEYEDSNAGQKYNGHKDQTSESKEQKSIQHNIKTTDISTSSALYTLHLSSRGNNKWFIIVWHIYLPIKENLFGENKTKQNIPSCIRTNVTDKWKNHILQWIGYSWIGYSVDRLLMDLQKA